MEQDNSPSLLERKDRQAAVTLTADALGIKAEGKHFKETLIIAGKERVRPILMTTLAMVFGTLPIAVAKGTAVEWKNGLADSYHWGLLSSLILTVF